MELLIGVVHCEEFLDNVVDVVSTRYPNGIESLMLEIPSNWAEIKRSYRLREDFFLELAQKYEEGSRVIFGGLPIDLSKNSSWWTLLIDAFVTHSTDKNMVSIIRDENPQVAIVGLSHANYIKRRFPEVYYVAFSVTPHDKADEFVIKVLGRPYNPDEIIPIRHSLPKEDYYQKYGIT